MAVGKLTITLLLHLGHSVFLSIKSFSESLSSRIRVGFNTFLGAFSGATREAVCGVSSEAVSDVSEASTLGRFGDGGVDESLEDVEPRRRAEKSTFTPWVRDMGVLPSPEDKDKDESSSYESLFSSAAAVGATHFFLATSCQLMVLLMTMVDFFHPLSSIIPVLQEIDL